MLGSPAEYFRIVTGAEPGGDGGDGGAGAGGGGGARVLQLDRLLLGCGLGLGDGGRRHVLGGDAVAAAA